MNWDQNTKKKFQLFISKMPLFHRRITEEVVVRTAEESARKRESVYVEEQDVVSAFFSGVPSPFYSLMVRLLEQTGFDYKKYGFPKS
jgi:hypothetical protein